MRILVALTAFRYGDAKNVEPSVEWFVETPRRMGHGVRLFNYAAWHPVDRDWMNDTFLETVQAQAYDLVLLLLAGDEFLPEVLDEVKRRTLLVAWNSDDDWRWEEHSSRLYPHFSYMVTTYRHVYEANRARYPNLLLSQWGCLSTYDGLTREKDLPVSFVGLRYGQRAEQVRALRRAAPVRAFGTGFGGREGDDGSLKYRLRREIAARLRLTPLEEPLSFAEINAIWARSRISFTPLEASRGGSLQIKSRVFDMGLSGTLMLCSRNPALDEFYERGKEYEDYGSMEECCDKVRFYLKNETDRQRIANEYYRRTRAEHLWEHRFQELFGRLPAETKR